MPFIDGDSRSCPDYGYICPEFMEDLNLSVKDLQIRAIIHSGNVAYSSIESGEIDENHSRFEICQFAIASAKKTMQQYPIERFPFYYE